MVRPGYGGLDRFRLLAVLLVVANHTGPLLSVSPQANYLVTDILARLAVPFFFTVSGFFLVPKLRASGAAALLPFLKKGLLLYGAATLLYLPVRVYAGYFSQPRLAPALVRDCLFDGTYFHLWYFPAVLLGACIVCPLVLRLPRAALWICGGLYLLGLLGDSYYGLTAALPPLRAAYDALFTFCFDQTRNGIFFAPLFLCLGGALSGRAAAPAPRPGALRVLLCAGLLLAEGLMVKALGLARYDAMYVSLPLCLWTLVDYLRALPAAPLPRLRRACTVMYLVHPLCIVGVRGVGRLLGLTWLLVACSPIHYLAVAGSAALAALPFALWGRRGKRPGGTRLSHIKPPPRAWVELDTGALRHNIAALRSLLSPGCALMAVVKADAYGHGAPDVARVCMEEGVSAFAVATAEEGAQLRRGGAKGEILVLGYTPAGQAGLLHRCNLTQAVVSAEHAAALEACGKSLKVHVKVDTGMHRLGIPWDDGAALRAVFSCPHLRAEGIFTHLADAETLNEADRERTQIQIRRFYSAVEELRQAGISTGAQHIQSTYGLLNYGALSCAYARCGIALCGVLSSPSDRTRVLPDLRPVLSLRARIGQIHDLAVGERAGYDGSFVAERPCRVALVTIGYADGYPRSLSCGVGRALVRGQSAPVAGLICMDQLLLDVTGVPDARTGDVVTLIGPDGDARVTAGEVADRAGTITNEIFSRLGPRLERVVR